MTTKICNNYKKRENYEKETQTNPQNLQDANFREDKKHKG